MLHKILISSALIIASLNISAQSLDFMGFPTDEKAPDQNIQINQNRSALEIQSLEIVKVIPSPFQYTADIAFDGELLWVNGYNEYQLAGIDPVTGAIMETINISIQRPYGMTYSDGKIYIIDNDTKEIVVIDRYTGSTIEIIELPQENTYPTGLEIQNGTFWYNDPTSPYAAMSGDLTRNLNHETNTIENYNAVGEYPSGIAFDGNYLWSTDNVSQVIHQVDKLTLETIRLIEAPGGIYPNGLTSDGEFLWVANNSSDSIYQIRINENSVSTNIAKRENSNSVKIFPTIASENINIDLGHLNLENLNIQIINQNGQVIDVISKENISNHTINWEIPNHLTNGMFFCRIENEEESISAKFIVIK